MGAILTQNTAWTNVEKAIGNLKREGILYDSGGRDCRKPRADFIVEMDKKYLRKLCQISEAKLAKLIRSAGYFNQKAKRLREFMHWVADEYGSIDQMFKVPAKQLREALLQVKGIGPETADSILLYGGGRSIFVVDAYTKRILSRHYLAKEGDDYHHVQELFMQNLPKKMKLYNEFHALIVRVGKELCKKGKPRCSECPLEGVNWGDQ